MAAPVGVPGLVTKGAVAVTADDSGAAPATPGNVPNVAVAVKGVTGGGRERRRLIPKRRDDPMPLRAATEGEAEPTLEPRPRTAAAIRAMEEAGSGRSGVTVGPIRVAARHPVTGATDGPPVEGRLNLAYLAVHGAMARAKDRAARAMGST